MNISELRANIDAWLDSFDKPTVRDGLMVAWSNGCESGRIESARGGRDNPYEGHQWRWAWFSGFDLGRRIRALVAACELVCDAHDEHAKRCNFTGCGCDTCKPLREALHVSGARRAAP